MPLNRESKKERCALKRPASILEGKGKNTISDLSHQSNHLFFGKEGTGKEKEGQYRQAEERNSKEKG